MADASSQAMSAANTSIKTAVDLELMLLNIFRDLLKQIPDKNFGTVMQKEMEKGNVEVELFNECDKDEVRKKLSEKNLKEGRDYAFKTYHRVDGEKFTALFYTIKDKDIIQGVKNNFCPSNEVMRQNRDFLDCIQKAGFSPDGTLDMEKFEKFCESKGINFDLNKELSPEDKEYAMKLISSQFANMSPEQVNTIAQKLTQTGIMDELRAIKAAGMVRPFTLYKMSMDANGKPSIQMVKGCSPEQVYAMEKRAQAYGLRISVLGPDKKDQFKVAFAAKDAETMRRVYAEASYDLKGKAGDLYKSQIQFENKYSSQAINAAVSGTYPDGTKIPAGSMVVGMKIEPLMDKNGKVMTDKDSGVLVGRQTLEFDGKRAYLNKESGELAYKAKTSPLSIGGKNYEEKINEMFGDANPVILNPQQADAYRRAATEKERMSIIQKAQEQGEHGFEKKPIMTKKDAEIIKEHEKYRELVSKKLQEKLPEDSKMAAYVYSMGSYEAYFHDQALNSEHAKDQREYYSGGNAFVNKAEMESSDVADALSDEDMRTIEEDAEALSDDMAMFDDMEDCTKEIETEMYSDVLLNRVDGPDADMITAIARDSFDGQELNDGQSVEDILAIRTV